MQLIYVSSELQQMFCYGEKRLWNQFPVSTAANGMGELMGSECTPRGWHSITDIIGLQQEKNAVFVGRQWTGEIYAPSLAEQYPQRDWILTRILRLSGMEQGRNRGGEVDSYNRYIYIHGSPDEIDFEKRGSHGCIRMKNQDIIALADWVQMDCLVYID